MVRESRYAFVPGGKDFPTITGGDGVWLHTADGRRILDGAGGAIVGNIGWGRPEIADVAAKALRGGAYSIPLWPSTQRLALVDELVEHWLPNGFTQLFFTSGGSESTDSALRLARAYQVAKGRPDRWRIVGRDPSYHGMTLGTIAVASHSSRQAGFEPMLLDFPHIPWDDAGPLAELLEREGDTIAGLIAEPFTGSAGACLAASDDYWRAVTGLCREHDVLLIADEVMCGYGRTGLTWGHEHFPFEPDVIAGGKGLGGGYVPIGAVATRADVAELLRGRGFMFFTFTGNDLACAVSAMVLAIMRAENLVERSAKLGQVLHERLHAELDGHPAVKEIRGRGLFAGLELEVSEAAVVGAALQRDLWVYPAGSAPVPHAIMLGPPLVITEPEIDTLVARLRASIDAAA